MRKTILIVDDEPDFVDMITLRLEANGYRVLKAYDGDSAFEEARRSNPDLILLDVMMPGKDGFKVLRELRRDEATRDTPVVMLTARGETKSIFKAQDSGATDYLIKPCESAELVQTCAKYA